MSSKYLNIFKWPAIYTIALFSSQ